MSLKRSLRRVKGTIQSLLWIVLIPGLRVVAGLRIGSLRPGGVTIVTVNWNSSSYLTVLLELVRRRSPHDVAILVVDNGSRDGTRGVLALHPDVRRVMLPMNVGHDMALDIGFLLARTEYVVALDVDAFPIREHWLAALLAPLSAGAQIAGARVNREFVHPCCLAMRTERFVRQKHSFRSRYRAREGERDASGDVGEDMSAREAPLIHFVERTSRRGPLDVGSVFGDLVYHNFYSTRFQGSRDGVLDRLVERGDPAMAWKEALTKYYDSSYQSS